MEQEKAPVVHLFWTGLIQVFLMASAMILIGWSFFIENSPKAIIVDSAGIVALLLYVSIEWSVKKWKDDWVIYVLPEVAFIVGVLVLLLSLVSYAGFLYFAFIAHLGWCWSYLGGGVALSFVGLLLAIFALLGVVGRNIPEER